MPKSKFITYATVGVLAYITADIVHEVIGHGGTCLLLGNKITLLTSVYFKSTPGNILVDIGGPLANLVCGLLALAILKRTKKLFSVLLLIHISLYNLFWLAGTVLHSGVSKSGDWTFAIKKLNIGQFQNYILAVTGVLLYVLVTQISGRQLISIVKKNKLTKQDFILPFLFASFFAFIAGLFFAPNRLHSGLEGLLEMAASIPILFLRFNYADKSHQYELNYKYVFAISLLYLLFCLSLGQGIVF
jgi:hypothetical protein